MNEELIFKLSYMEQQSQELESNITFINNQIQELIGFQQGLDTIENTSQKEILCPLGKGVHVKANLQGKELFIEVGAGVIVKKTSGEAKEIIDSQVKRLHEARIQLTEHLAGYSLQMQELIEQIDKLNA